MALSPFVVNGLAGAAGGLARTLYGWSMKDDRDKFSWKLLGGSLISGFIGGFKIPDPIGAATMGWLASEAMHKAYRKAKKVVRKLPENK